ncbi:arsenic efflux protein [bacterium]|nr:arsenic efflux protein [bacterium]
MASILHFMALTFHYLTSLPEHLIEPIEWLPEFLKEALIDSLNLVPLLFIIFVLLEVLEHYFAKKKHLVVFWMKKIGPLFGSLFASLPQCGFSVIASTLYVRRILSRGTILAVYLATSDEAIPVIMAEPSKGYLILPIILVKVFVAIIVGYLVDLFVGYQANDPLPLHKENECHHEHEHEGCDCNHHPKKLREAIRTKGFWWHPTKHTINIFIFILIVSVILGYLMEVVGTEENLAKYCLMNSPLQPLLVSLLGLIPNCAVSVAMTLLFLKNTISFGSLIAGLSTAGGLGLLILFTKNNDKKDTAIVLTILVGVSTIVGLILQYNVFGINKIFSIFGLDL